MMHQEVADVVTSNFFGFYDIFLLSGGRGDLEAMALWVLMFC
jgi:hypothetical protein